MKNKKIIITLSIIVVLILTIGITFAVFNYNKVGTKNSSLVVGDIYMHYNETNELTIENAMPLDGARYLHNKNITEEEVNKCVTHLTSLWGKDQFGYKNFCNGTGTDGANTFQDYLDGNSFSTDSLNYFETNNIIKMHYKSLPYFEFTIDGKNTTPDKNIYYEIKTSYGDTVNGKGVRIRDDLLKFILIEYNNGVEKRILTDYSFVDLNNQTIWANSIDSNTNEEIKRTYRLYMWVSNDTKICSGEMTENCDYYTSQTPNWSDVFASIKINVSGDFIEKKVNYNILTNDLLSGIDVTKDKISEINFLKLTNEEINTKYQAATYKKSGINPLYAGDGIKIWLENDATDTTKYIMNIASNDTIYFPSDSSKLFYRYSSLKNINFSNVDTSNVKNMYCMFWGCSGLTSLDLSNFNTSSVTDMSFMFMSCSGLTNLDVSNFDTSKVTTFMNMFLRCSSLISLDVSNFNTSSANNMHGMFWGCSGLTSLDVSNFNTSNTKNMRGLFVGCSGLTSLDVSNFNTSNVEDMELMFGECTKLTNLDLSNFDTSKVTNMSSMFSGSKSLTSLDLSSFDTSNVTDMEEMFDGCTGLTNLDLSNFNTSKVIYMYYMFNGLGLNATSPVNIAGLENFDTSNVTDMVGMFMNGEGYTGSGKLTNETLAGISNWNVSKVIDFTCMFYGQGTYLTTLDLSKWDTSSATSFNHMFTDCFKLTSLDLSNWNTSNVLTMYNMFDDNYALTTIGDISKWNVTKLVDIGGFLNGCTSFTGINNKLDLSGWVTSSLRGAQEAFRGIKVKEIDISNWDTTKINSQKWTGAGSGIYYSYSTDMNIMFKDCVNLDVVYVGSNWSTANTTTTDMFSGAKISEVTKKA